MLAALAPGCDGDDAPAVEPSPREGTPGRIVVLDAEGRVRVVDGSTAATVVIPGTDAPEASDIVRGGGGAVAYLVAPGSIRALDPGFHLGSGGGVAETVPPAWLPFEVAGEGTPRLLVNGGVATAYFPGEREVRWWPDDAVGRLVDDPDAEVPVRRLPGALPQDEGLAVAFGANVVVSRPAVDDDPPSLDLLPREPDDRGGDAGDPPPPLARFAGCSGPDAAAEAPGGVIGVACRDVVYVLRRTEPEPGAEVTGVALSVPIFDGISRIARLRADPAGMPLVGTYGDSVLLRVEPDRVVRVDLSLPIVDLGFLAPRHLTVLLGDGSLLEADPAEGPTGRGARVAAAPEAGAPPLPLSLGLGAQTIYVGHGEVPRLVEVDAERWQVRRVLDVGVSACQLLPYPGPMPDGPGAPVDRSPADRGAGR